MTIDDIDEEGGSMIEAEIKSNGGHHLRESGLASEKKIKNLIDEAVKLYGELRQCRYN